MVLFFIFYPYQIKIINRQTSEPVQGPDEQGEICIKSPQCFKGYLNQGDLLKGIVNCLDGARSQSHTTVPIWTFTFHKKSSCV